MKLTRAMFGTMSPAWTASDEIDVELLRHGGCDCDDSSEINLYREAYIEKDSVRTKMLEARRKTMEEMMVQKDPGQYVERDHVRLDAVMQRLREELTKGGASRPEEEDTAAFAPNFPHRSIRKRPNKMENGLPYSRNALTRAKLGAVSPVCNASDEIATRLLSLSEWDCDDSSESILYGEPCMERDPVRMEMLEARRKTMEALLDEEDLAEYVERDYVRMDAVMERLREELMQGDTPKHEEEGTAAFAPNFALRFIRRCQNKVEDGITYWRNGHVSAGLLHMLG